jgi:hypothetical protein
LIAFLELLAATLLSSNLSFFLFLALFLLFGVATFSAARSGVRPNEAWRWRAAGCGSSAGA